ncbi:hypothetical protein RF11_01043 [Thelohanellus kitauei]|uniref:Reverse transcriptase domain-containing protein n=1 Tax=Thelohanellus kitauei TaxID=669202 RepID=A0A0C2JQX1_THEKT|nr:hypothetical protein RF11_01043 [Thelohanellus kitauei]
MVKVELIRQVENGILTSIGHNEWDLPMVVVQKANGQIDDILLKLKDSRVLCDIDLLNAYFQVELDEESKKLIVIRTPFDLFLAPAICEWYIDNLICKILNYAPFFDEIIMSGYSVKSHMSTLNAVLSTLMEN